MKIHCELSVLFLSKEKNETKRRPVKSLFPRSHRVFREVQNSRAFGPLKHAALLFLKILALSGLFKGVIDIKIKNLKSAKVQLLVKSKFLFNCEQLFYCFFYVKAHKIVMSYFKIQIQGFYFLTFFILHVAF